MKQFCVYLLFCFLAVFATAQTDSIPVKPDSSFLKITAGAIEDSSLRNDSLSLNTDTSLLQTDSLKLVPGDTLFQTPIKKTPEWIETKSGRLKSFSGKELLFYYLVLLFLFLGLLRQAFPKYFQDLFRVFFRTTLKQKQIREQLLQSSVPSVLMNVFFVLSAGLYILFLFWHFHLLVSGNFWLQYLYSIGSLAFIYSIKFLGLKFTGWLLNVKETSESYTFIVFIINKIMGIGLLPFLVLLAFSTGVVYDTALRLSWIGVGILVFYRVILTYNVVRNEIKLNPFHFLLYILAFEIVPLLLIYKLLLIIF